MSNENLSLGDYEKRVYLELDNALTSTHARDMFEDDRLQKMSELIECCYEDDDYPETCVIVILKAYGYSPVVQLKA